MPSNRVETRGTSMKRPGLVIMFAVMAIAAWSAKPCSSGPCAAASPMRPALRVTTTGAGVLLRPTAVCQTRRDASRSSSWTMDSVQAFSPAGRVNVRNAVTALASVREPLTIAPVVSSRTWLRIDPATQAVT